MAESTTGHPRATGSVADQDVAYAQQLRYAVHAWRRLSGTVPSSTQMAMVMKHLLGAHAYAIVHGTIVPTREHLRALIVDRARFLGLLESNVPLRETDLNRLARAGLPPAAPASTVEQNVPGSV